MANLDITARLQDEASGPAGKIANNIGDMEREASTASAGFAALQTIGVAALVAIAAAVTAVVVGMGSFVASGVQMAMDMEASLSNIAAVLGETKEEVEPLGDLISELGLNPNLKVTAEEAAEAINNLATNGLNMQQILDGAAESTVLLANSTGADFGTAANIATDSMAIFNIEAEDMMAAVNGITSVTVASKFGVEDYGLALAQAGGVASAAGVEFDDFNTAITAISPLFASGSDAGTSFKTMLTRLIPGSNKAEDAMKALNIIGVDTAEAFRVLSEQGFTPASESMQDVMGAAVDMTTAMGLQEDEVHDVLEEMGLLRNRFFDAEGNMESMAEVAGLLQESFAGLSEEQRNEALATIFGADSMRAAVGLMEAGEEGFNSLAETMAQTDAMESAATRMDNLAGVMEIIQGVIDTVKLQVGQAFLPVLRLLADHLLELANGVGPAVVGFFEGVANTISTIVPIFLNMLAAIQGGGIGVLGVFEDGSSYLGAFLEALGMTETAANNLATGFINLVTQISAFLEPIITAVTQFVSWQDVLMALGVAIAAVVLPALYAIVTAVAPVIAVGALLIGAIALLRNAWEQNWGGIQEKTAAAVAFIQNAIAVGLAFIQEFWAQHGEFITAVLVNMWNNLVFVVSTAVAIISAVITAVLTGIQEFWAANGEAILAKAQEVWAAIQTAVSTAITTIETTIITVATALQTFWAAHGELILATAQRIWTTIQEYISGVWTVIQSLFAAFKAAFEGDWEGFGENLRLAWEAAWQTVMDYLENLWSIVAPILAEFVFSAIEYLAEVDWGGVGSGIVQGIANGLSAAGHFLVDAAVSAAQAALDAAKGFLGIESPSTVAADEIGKPFTEGLAQGVIDTVDVLEDAVFVVLKDGLTVGQTAVVALDPAAIGATFGTLLAEGILAEADTVSTAVQGLLDVAGSISSIGGSFSNLFRQQELEPMREQVEGLEDGINDLLSGPLADVIERLGTDSLSELYNLAGFAPGTFTGEELDALQQAYELERLRAEAAAEYVAMQEHALELQRQQADLQFLQQQMELLDLIAAHGLDANAILGGIELGLNANLPDLLDAMAAAMQAIIAQAEGELGISSPSRVFADLMREVGAGAVAGLGDARGMVSDAAVSLSDSLMEPFTTSTLPMAGLSEPDTALAEQKVVIHLINPQFYGVQDVDNFLEQVEALAAA